ncbi:MAG: CdaR family protein [Bacteroidota bacterium]
MKPNLATIISSTIFSIVLWVFVSFSDEYTTIINVPIEFTEFKDDYTIQSQSTFDATLSLQGVGWALAQVTMGPENKLEISTEQKTGKQQIQLREVLSQNPWLTSSVQVVRINPTQIDYSVERMSNKIVPIIPNISVGTKSDYGLVSEITLKPDSVRITGPRSLIRKMNAVITKSIVYEELDDMILEDVSLEPIKHVSYELNSCKINFDVQKIVDKVFDEIPVEVIGVPPSRELSLFPSKINVTLRGGIKTLGTLNPDEIYAYVKFQQAFKDTLGIVEPTIEIPKFTKTTNVEPKALNYIIKQY